MHVDPGFVFYFAAELTLSAVLFSMCLNVVLALRQHADFEQATIPLRTVLPHYAVSAVVAAWAAEFTIVQLSYEGFLFGAALVAASIASFAAVGQRDLLDREPISVQQLSRVPIALMVAHPLLAVAAAGFTLVALQLDSDLYLISLALLATLGLPLSGAAALLWFPLAPFVITIDRDGLPYVFLALAAACALLVSAFAICTAASPPRGARVLNRLLGRGSLAL